MHSIGVSMHTAGRMHRISLRMHTAGRMHSIGLHGFMRLCRSKNVKAITSEAFTDTKFCYQCGEG